MNTVQPSRNPNLAILRVFVVKTGPNPPRRREDAKNHEEFSISAHAFNAIRVYPVRRCPPAGFYGSCEVSGLLRHVPLEGHLPQFCLPCRWVEISMFHKSAHSTRVGRARESRYFDLLSRPMFSAIRAFTSFRTRATGRGLSA